MRSVASFPGGRHRPTRLAAALALALLPATIGAQGVRGPDVPVRPPGQPSITTGWKDEHRARVLGTLVPGLGHVYAEEFTYGRDLFTLSTIGLAGAAIAMIIAPESANRSSTYAIAAGCGALGVGAWAWSAYDAPRAARRTNARRILRHDASFAPFLQRSPAGPVLAGLSLGL